MIELTRIVKKRHGRTRLRFNTGDTLRVPSRVVNKLDLEEGQTCSLDSLRRDIRELCREVLPELARSHLMQYTKTTSEFKEHFTRKGYPETLVGELVDQLRREGLLDDRQVARRHVEKRLSNKRYGREKIIAELKEKGFESQQARSLVNELYPEQQERKKAQEYVDENDDLDSKTLASRLKNRGFSGSIIHELVSPSTW